MPGHPGELEVTRSQRRRIRVGLALALSVALLLIGLFLVGFLSTAVLASTDFLFKVPSSAQARATVIVAVDRRSVDALTPTLGPFREWPRSVYAQALDAVTRGGARVVLFDIFFDGTKEG